MGRLFGTDGARGLANQELTCELAMQIGRAAAYVLAKENGGRRTKIIIGKDTRLSSDMLEAAIASGFCSVGADVLLLGVVPTPAVAYLVKEYNADAGVMISASHNPFEYNGIKLFDGNGYKLPDDVEDEIEAIILDGAEGLEPATGADLGCIRTAENAVQDYIDHIIGTIDGDLRDVKLVLDCSNGSASKTAQSLFIRLGAEIVSVYDAPNGTNINKECGSTHINNLSRFVVDSNADLGLAFDGDADRCLAVDENGTVIDGDKIIAIISNYLDSKGELNDSTVVVTVMSNIGFFKFAEGRGLNAVTTKVGDRYVLEKMKECNYSIGGEQSGHIIFSKYASTGDGQLTGVQLVNVMKKTGKPLSELASVMETYPQVLVNIKVSAEGKSRYAGNEDIRREVERAEELLGGDGRILVRPSGTEPLIRVMVEGKDIDEITELANSVADVIREKLA